MLWYGTFAPGGCRFGGMFGYSFELHPTCAVPGPSDSKRSRALTALRSTIIGGIPVGMGRCSPVAAAHRGKGPLGAADRGYGGVVKLADRCRLVLAPVRQQRTGDRRAAAGTGGAVTKPC